MSSTPSAAAFLFAWAYAWQLAFDLGRAHERERIGDAVHEVDACWEALGELDACRYRAPRTWEQQVAERVAVFERHATATAWPGVAGLTRGQRRAVYRHLLASWDRPAEPNQQARRRAA
jgi:hypothetical protein